MKNKIFSLLTLFVLALGLTSCHDDLNPGVKTTGEGSVNLSSIGVEINNVEKVIASSRASVDLSDFLIDIVNTDDNSTAASWKYSAMPELFTLPVGNYKVKVKSHEVQKAEWEKPYFVGEKTFSVTNDAITEIGVVTCTLSNIKVTIGFSDELKALMGDDCKVTVYVNDEGSLEFTKEETRAGYFEAVEGSTTLVAEFTGTVDGNEEYMSFKATDVEAGQYRKITFKIKDNSTTPPVETGSISIEGGIKIDVDYDEINLAGNVTSEEENLGDSDRPGKEDPLPGEGGGDNSGDNTESTPITFTCATASFDEPNEIDASKSYVVNIKAENGIEHLYVTIDPKPDADQDSYSEDFLLSLSDLDIPTSFDLANPGDKASIYKNSLGLPVGDEVVGATELDFDISNFVPLLKNPNFKGVHKFKLQVVDSKGNELTKTLTFVNK
jgi:hypothetical protein